jgi:hypothetical protein
MSPTSFTVDDPSVARFHLQIACPEQRDLGSQSLTNQPYLHRTQISAEHAISNTRLDPPVSAATCLCNHGMADAPAAGDDSVRNAPYRFF